MVTICFTPRLFLGFKVAKSDIFSKFNLTCLPVLRAGMILYNAVITTGPLNSISDIKVVLNEKFNLYDIVNSHVNEFIWASEFRSPTIHEISEVYDTVVTLIHYLTTDIFQMLQRGYQQPPILQDISIQESTGYLYV